MLVEACPESAGPAALRSGVFFASELIKQHESSRWHKDSVITARMAQQCEQQSVAEMYTSAATQEAAKRKEKNSDILLKLLRSIYFLVKNRIPHSTTYSELVQLEVMNGDKLLQQHITEGTLNARYTSRFSATVLIRHMAGEETCTKHSV